MYLTLAEIKKEFTSSARWWCEKNPDLRFKLGEVYTVRLLNREDSKSPRTGQVVYSVNSHCVKLRSEDGENELYIYPKDELEIIKNASS